MPDSWWWEVYDEGLGSLGIRDPVTSITQAETVSAGGTMADWFTDQSSQLGSVLSDAYPQFVGTVDFSTLATSAIQSAISALFSPTPQETGQVITGVPPIPGVPETIPWPVTQSSRQLVANVGGNCWTEYSDPRKAARAMLRRRVRFARRADGGLQMIQSCAPRRMNPLNPRALSRAARRLGSFQRIASSIEKTIQRACKVKSRRSSYRPRYSSGKCCN